MAEQAWAVQAHHGTDKKPSLSSSQLLSRQLREEAEKRKQMSSILAQRRSEFANMIQTYYSSGKGAHKVGQSLTAPDLDQISQAFGVKLTP